MKHILFIPVLFIHLVVFAQTTNPASVNSTSIMQDENIQIEATEAMNSMYNFKFEIAETKFKELIKRYPEHPLPYYLVGLSNWWRMMPYIEDDPMVKKYQPLFDEYMDLSIEKAEVMYKKNEEDIEATFFLCAAHGLIARHYAENGQEMRSLNHTRKTFSYFKKLNDNNELSPEFLFGSALFNYYAAWFRQEYPVLKPVLSLFPKGDKELGIKQLKEVYNNAFWTRTEAQYFLMRIYYNEEEDERTAFEYADYLATTYPDNPYFQRIYARICFTIGKYEECKETSDNIIYKINIGMPGYEATSGRYASFFLGKLYKSAGNQEKSKEYYKKAIAFAEQTEATNQNYYLYAIADLARMCDKEKDIASAREYYETILDKADRDNSLRQEAKDYLKKTEEKKKGWW